MPHTGSAGKGLKPVKVHPERGELAAGKWGRERAGLRDAVPGRLGRGGSGMLPHRLPLPWEGHVPKPPCLGPSLGAERRGEGGSVLHPRCLHPTQHSCSGSLSGARRRAVPCLLSQRTRNKRHREAVQPPQGHTAVNRRNRPPAKTSGTVMGSTGQSVRHSMDASVLEFQTLVVPVN